MTNELISVIIPVYNTESYLAPCLDSVLSQSYRNLEVIIINDGSTDYSLRVAEGYAEKDDRVKVYTQQNEGQASARNKGLEVATGDYIMFVDADDQLLPRSIEIMLRMLIKYEVDIVEGKIIKGKLHGNLTTPKNLHSKIYTCKEAINDVLYQKKLTASVWGKLYKKRLFNNLRFIKGIIYEDLDIIYKIFAEAEKILFIDYPVYFYRYNDSSTVNTWSDKRLDVLKVTEELETFIAEKYPELLPAARDRRLSANFNMFALCTLNDDHKNAFNCWEHIKRNRRQSLFNSNVRIKNKAGIILSYFGKNIFNIAARRVYK